MVRTLTAAGMEPHGALRRRWLLAAVMTSVAALTALVALGVMYQIAVDVRSDSLRDKVTSRAALVEAIWAQTGDREATLRILADAQRIATPAAKSLEITVGSLRGQTIEIISRRAADPARSTLPMPIPLAEAPPDLPMLLALQGSEGSIVGTDYRGDPVLAAYRPIPALGWGIVAKMDLSEVREPFWRALAATSAAALLLIGLGVLAFVRVSEPMIRQVEESERRYRALFDGVPVGLYRTSPEGVFVDANPALAAILGHPDVASVRAAGVGSVYAHAEDRERWRQQLEARGEVQGTEVEFRRADGATGWVRHSARVVRDGSGRVVAYEGAAEDVTEQHAALEALRHSEASLANAQRIAHIGNWDWEIATGNLTWSGEIYRIFGYEPGQFAASYDAFLGRIHPEDRARVSSAVGAAVESDGEGECYAVDHRIVRPDGAIRWVHEQGEVVREPDGRPVRMVGTVHDITARVEAEQTVRERQRLLDAVLETLPVGVWIADGQGRLVYGNPAAQGVWQGARYVPPEEFDQYRGWWRDTGKPIAPEEWAVVRAIRDGVASGEEEIEIECFDGTRKIILNAAAPVRDEQGAITAAVIINVDLTERVRAEEKLADAMNELERQRTELARSNAELERFAYVASHDLQEPLRMVASFTQLLARRYRGKLDATADEFIDYATDGARRMQALIDDLLRLSRVGTRGADLVPVEAGAVLKRCLHDLAPTIEESGATVCADELPTVAADEGQLGQLFQNLLMNAIRFRSDEPPRIHVGAQRRNGDWEFSVRDNGIGIAPEHFDRVFLIFQRLHGRDTHPGTGIGLAICKKIVERHGGRIWVDSAPGAGSTFHFTLPALEGSPA